MGPVQFGILIAFIATILFGTTGALLYQATYKTFKSRSSPPFTSQTSPQNTSPTPESTQNNVSEVSTGWKTYKDETNEYSLKYPPGWNLEKDANYVGPQTPNYTFIFEKKQEFMPGVAIYVVSHTTPKEWPLISGLDKYGSIKPVNINGNKGVEVINIPGALLQKWVFLDKKDKTTIIYSSGDERDFPIFDQILSTFKFIVPDQEKQQIDSWIQQHNLNQYGDPKDRMYAGGTPLFDERTGQTMDRYDYIVKNHADKPWNGK